MGATRDLPDAPEKAEAFQRYAWYASEWGHPIRGYHNDNFVTLLTPPMAEYVGLEPGTPVTVRMRRREALPVVIRTWDNEAKILDAVGAVLKHVPECLVEGDGFAIHSYVEGAPLSRSSDYGETVDLPRVEQLAELMAQMAQVDGEPPLPLPYDWPDDEDSQGFLRTLARLTDEQIRQPNWTEFGGLFQALGVPDDALKRLAEEAPDMTRRPYSLLHTDLHRDNLIVTDSGEPPVVCVDWELATFGDPLHDLATHLVRMRYPLTQWDEVIKAWSVAMGEVRPRALDGLDKDLAHYVDFERAQSVYPDVMRAAGSLAETCDDDSLAKATRAVRRALNAAAKPLRLPRVPGRAETERALRVWHESRRHTDRRPVVGKGWEPDEAVGERIEFPFWAVRKALAAADGAAPGGLVFKGTTHVSWVVRVPDVGSPVVVRRMAAEICRREPTFLSEHKVLQAIEKSKVPVAVPRIYALGTSQWGERFAIHTYEGPRNTERLPDHPVKGLSPHEADRLVDQLCALTDVDYALIADDVGKGGFYTWLSVQLVELVRNLPKESRQVARLVGLPDAARLKDILARRTTTHRTPVLLHGDLNPWNLVRREDDLALTLIDWEMAVVGDPLYDLVRHIHLTPTPRDIRNRMFDRWEKTLDPEFTVGWQQDWHVYRKIETIRSAYIDLDRLVTGVSLDAPNVRRAVDSYAMTLTLAAGSLGLPARPMDNPYLTLTRALA